MLELGQCAMPMPRSAKKARSSASSMQQCANQQSFSSHPISLRGTAPEPKHNQLAVIPARLKLASTQGLVQLSRTSWVEPQVARDASLHPNMQPLRQILCGPNIRVPSPTNAPVASNT